MAVWATSKRQAPRNICATPGSRRYTRAQTASRLATSSGRKLARDRGEAAQTLFADIGATLVVLEPADSSDIVAIGGALRAGLAALETATAQLVDSEPAAAAAGSAPYLQLLGTVCAGWLMARQALAADRLLAAGEAEGDPAFLRAKITTARFYAEHFLALAPGHLPAILGAATVLDFDPDQF